MKFKRLINKSKETRRKYEYYLSLGYSEHAAKVLSVVTYGDEKLVFLIKQLGRKNVMEELYAWLHERKEGTPEEAIEAFYEEKHPRPKYEEERGRMFRRRYHGIRPCFQSCFFQKSCGKESSSFPCGSEKHDDVL